jgi:Fur family transcriptional regulator, zinc uptake regulator
MPCGRDRARGIAVRETGAAPLRAAAPGAGGPRLEPQAARAYEIIDLIASKKPRPAPITVYRALEFLIRNGLAHRIESRNAFLACAQNHEIGALVAFLICDTCGAVGEASTAAVTRLLADAAGKAGFRPSMSVIEITGTCFHCRAD